MAQGENVRMNMSKSASAILALLLSPFASFAMDQKCTSSPILGEYIASGMATESPDGGITISFDADTHFADCGASDCYGTHVVIRMKPTNDGLCTVGQVEVEAAEYNKCKDKPAFVHEDTAKQVIEAFFPSGGPLRLGEADRTSKIALFNQSKSRAIVILSSTVYYFEKVSPNGVLRMELQGEDDSGEACCWGAAPSRGQFEPRSVGP